MARRRNSRGFVLQRWAVPWGHGTTSRGGAPVLPAWWLLTPGLQRFCETMFLEDVLVAHG